MKKLVCMVLAALMGLLGTALAEGNTDQAAIDAHHQSPMMARLAVLREQYDLHMTAERYQSIDAPDTDARFLRT